MLQKWLLVLEHASFLKLLVDRALLLVGRSYFLMGRSIRPLPLSPCKHSTELTV